MNLPPKVQRAWPTVRALLILAHLVAITLQALPSPAGVGVMAETSTRRPVGPSAPCSRILALSWP